MRRKNICVIFMMISVLLASCGMKETAKPAHHEAASEEKNSSKQEALATKNKYNAYVEANNFMTDHLRTTLGYYKKTFGLDINKLDTSKKSIVVSSIPMTYIDIAMEKFRFYDKEPVRESLDPMAKELEPVIRELAQQLIDADLYYKGKNYMDDDFAEGKEIHKKLCTVYLKYQQKQAAFTSELLKWAFEHSQQDMENYKENKEFIPYYAIGYIRSSVEFSDSLQTGPDAANRGASFDRTKLKEQYAALSGGIDHLMQAVREDPGAAGKFEQYNFKDFLDYAQQTKAAAAELLKDSNSKDMLPKLASKYRSKMLTMLFYYNRVVMFSKGIDNLNYFPTT